MLDRQQKQKILGFGDLPTLPEVITQILEITADSGSSACEVGSILESDHAISARVLHLANSAFFGLPNRVDSLRRAVVLLGFQTVRSLALATSVFDAFFQVEQFSLDPYDFWIHSFGTAKAAHQVAERVEGIESSEGCFTAGLIHDIGKYVLSLALKDEYTALVDVAMETGTHLREVERAQTNVDHCEVGAWLCERWNFPPRLVDVVANAERSSQYSGPFPLEVRVVDLADQLSRKAGFGYAGDPPNPEPDDDLLDSLSISRDSITGDLEQLQDYREEAKRLLDLLSEGS